MRRIKLIASILTSLLLVGCSKSYEVAYWTDASYKSTLDYDAEQMKELSDEIGNVHTAIKDILEEMEDPIVNEEVVTTPSAPEESDLFVEDATLSECVSAFRSYLKTYRTDYGNYAYIFPKDVLTGISLDNPLFITQGTTYFLPLVKSAQTFSDSEFEQYFNILLGYLFQGDAPYTITYGEFKSNLESYLNNLAFFGKIDELN